VRLFILFTLINLDRDCGVLVCTALCFGGQYKVREKFDTDNFRVEKTPEMEAAVFAENIALTQIYMEHHFPEQSNIEI
jgi:hypothetical protein